MKDDLIDKAGCELGLPSHEELLKHQCDLLCSELGLTRRDLRGAHKELSGLISMYRQACKELGTLKVEHERLRWTLSGLYRRERDREAGKMVYQYGDHTLSKKILNEQGQSARGLQAGSEFKMHLRTGLSTCSTLQLSHETQYPVSQRSKTPTYRVFR